jgi:hypothetical protein
LNGLLLQLSSELRPRVLLLVLLVGVRPGLLIGLRVRLLVRVVWYLALRRDGRLLAKVELVRGLSLGLCLCLCLCLCSVLLEHWRLLEGWRGLRLRCTSCKLWRLLGLLLMLMLMLMLLLLIVAGVVVVVVEIATTLSLSVTSATATLTTSSSATAAAIRVVALLEVCACWAARLLQLCHVIGALERSVHAIVIGIGL